MSENGQAVTKYFEFCKLTGYPDPATGGAPWTIGWGHTGWEVVPGLVWTQAQTDAVLERDLGKFEVGVTAAVSRPITQSQFDDMVSLAYNIGLEHFKTSTLLRLFNAGDTAGAMAQFARWNRAGGRPMHGLIRRRAAQSWLYHGATAAEASKDQNARDTAHNIALQERASVTQMDSIGDYHRGTDYDAHRALDLVERMRVNFDNVQQRTTDTATAKIMHTVAADTCRTERAEARRLSRQLRTALEQYGREAGRADATGRLLNLCVADLNNVHDLAEKLR